MNKLKKRQKETIGSILEINIENRYFTYAQILPEVCVFFDFRSKTPLRNLSILQNVPILFFLCIYKQVITKGEWLKVGKMPIREVCKSLPNYYIQDDSNPQHFEMYITETGEIVPSTREECLGLERCAVWDSNHVEDRIRDHYLNAPCIWGEYIKKETKGSILEINIENKYFTYAQIVNTLSGACVFFDYKSLSSLKDFSVLQNAPILFSLCVNKKVITMDCWPKVGKMPIREDCKSLPNYSIQDDFNPQRFEMYVTDTGEIVPSTREECMGLERCAVWDADHIEDRICNHYMDDSNICVDSMK